jgi:predicted phage terminase large subunit-like protein
MKVQVGSATFSAQYQQSPIPAGGNMVDWKWFNWFDLDGSVTIDDIVISWDTAMKPTELADYSVGTVWGIRGGLYYLLDLIRVRLDYPALRRKVIEVNGRWQDPTILIEDAGSGTSLLQDLYDQDIPAVGIKPEGDKVLRMSAQTAKIEAGAVHLPRQAPWLDDLRSELLAFPNGRHDDQVDSISQALFDIARRLCGRFQRLPFNLMSRKSLAIPRNVAGLANLAIIHEIGGIPHGPCVVIGNGAKWSWIDTDQSLFDLQIIDEAYQLPDYRYHQIAGLATRQVLIGDPARSTP